MFTRVKPNPTDRPIPRLTAPRASRPVRPKASPDFFVGLSVATPVSLVLWAVIVWSIWWLVA
ncbi:MAG TPA: hypothetical protein VKB09_06360 [Thermomicrobiales bacterium]|nr:hypothetical protein [Thermomicrobiales bacterium]